jgi:hypothetical protein
MKKLLALLVSTLIITASHAGHNFNMVTHSFSPHPTLPNTYLIILEAVMPCGGGVAPDSIQVTCEWVGAMTFGTNKRLLKASENVLPTSPTIGITTNCQVANSNIQGFRVVSYIDTIAALGALASVTFRDCDRANFTNMDTSCVANRMTKNVASNWESNIGSTRVLYMYANSTLQYNMNVSDLEGDSTSIKLVPPADSMQLWGTSLNYQSANYKNGYSFMQPLGIGSSIAILDTFLNISSQNPGVYLVTVQIEDYDTTMALPLSLSKSLNDFIIVVMPNNPTSITNLSTSLLEIFPNPTVEKVKVSGLVEMDELIIQNQLGQEVYREKMTNSGYKEIVLGHLPNGVYFVHARRGDMYSVVKLVKQ